jgi:hypothetical protein
MEHRLTVLVADHSSFIEEPVHAPVARNHPILHREHVAGLSRAAVLGEDAVAIVRVDDLHE